MISCIILAAGESARFNSPKALAKIGSKTILHRLQEELLSSKVDEIIVVLGAWADQLKPCLLDHKNIQFVYNKDYKFGQTSSFKAGLRGVSKESKGVMLLPVDFPLIDKKIVDFLCAAFAKENYQKIIIPSFHLKKGHPPIFPIALKKDFLGLKNDEGLNMVALNQPENTVIISIDHPAVIKTFNTQQELQDILK